MFYVGALLSDEHNENTEFTCKNCKIKLEYYRRDCHDISPSKYYFDKAFFSYKYIGEIRQLMLKYKFYNHKYLYKFFAYDLSNKLLNYLAKTQTKIDYIVAVPISFKRYLERGYNQSWLIASEVSQVLDVPTLRFCLIKFKHNKRQSELSMFQRATNTKDVYNVFFKKSIEGKNILLIDDIYTTGSTVNECSKVLKKCGANRIIVAVSTRA